MKDHVDETINSMMVAEHRNNTLDKTGSSTSSVTMKINENKNFTRPSTFLFPPASSSSSSSFIAVNNNRKRSTNSGANSPFSEQQNIINEEEETEQQTSSSENIDNPSPTNSLTGNSVKNLLRRFNKQNNNNNNLSNPSGRGVNSSGGSRTPPFGFHRSTSV